MSYCLGDANTGTDLETSLFQQLHAQAQALYAAKQTGDPSAVATAQSSFDSLSQDYLAAGGTADQISSLQDSSSITGQISSLLGSATGVLTAGAVVLGLYVLFRMTRK